jgi:HEAT repeat protein
MTLRFSVITLFILMLFTFLPLFSLTKNTPDSSSPLSTSQLITESITSNLNKDFIERTYIAEAVGKFRDESLAPILCKFLRDPDERVRTEAAKSLALCGKNVGDSLVAALSDWSPKVRAEAVNSLGTLGIASSAAQIENKLNDSYPLVRKAAAKSLGMLCQPSSLNVLIQQANDWDAGVKAEIVYALGFYDDDHVVKVLRSALSDANPEVRTAACISIARLNRASCEQDIVKALGDWDVNVKYNAIIALGELNSISMANKLETMLSDSNAQVRMGIVKTLGVLRQNSSIVRLINITGDWDPQVRKEAIIALTRYPQDKKISDVICKLTSDPSSDVRAVSINSVGVLKLNNKTNLLINSMDDWDSGCRKAAATALGIMMDKKAVKPLLVALKSDPDYKVRVEAARSLGEIGDVSARLELQNATNDWNEAVSTAARISINKLGK